MGWLIVIGLGIVLFGLGRFIWLRLDDREMRDWVAANPPPPPVLDPAIARRLYDSGEFEKLRQFIVVYFHQDWEDDYDDEDGVVQGYFGRHADSPDEVDKLLEEMDALLALDLNDEELHEALGVLGSYLGWSYYPDHATSKWLCSLREKLVAARQMI